MVDLITSDRRVALAIGFSRFPAVSHEGMTFLRVHRAGPVRRIQAPGSVGGGAAERYAGATFTI